MPAGSWALLCLAETSFVDTPISEECILQEIVHAASFACRLTEKFTEFFSDNKTQDHKCHQMFPSESAAAEDL